MPKGERSKLQTVPPVGIKSSDWNGRKNVGTRDSKHKPGRFSISCAMEDCYYRQSSNGNPTSDKSLRCGVDRPRICPNGHVFPVNGYV